MEGEKVTVVLAPVVAAAVAGAGAGVDVSRRGLLTFVFQVVLAACSTRSGSISVPPAWGPCSGSISHCTPTFFCVTCQAKGTVKKIQNTKPPKNKERKKEMRSLVVVRKNSNSRFVRPKHLT